MKLIIIPEGWPCTFAECRPGFFVMNKMLYLKTEYHTGDKIDAYCGSGEYFAGGVSTEKERMELMVQPVIYRWEVVE